jgi:hypothetical protein
MLRGVTRQWMTLGKSRAAPVDRLRHEARNDEGRLAPAFDEP